MLHWELLKIESCLLENCEKATLGTIENRKLPLRKL